MERALASGSDRDGTVRNRIASAQCRALGSSGDRNRTIKKATDMHGSMTLHIQSNCQKMILCPLLSDHDSLLGIYTVKKQIQLVYVC
jgi:hypothetical protein